jgi:hypothetical protein
VRETVFKPMNDAIAAVIDSITLGDMAQAYRTWGGAYMYYI